MVTISDIIAELRSVAFSMKVHDAMMPEVYDILCGVAFRLESAWKREGESVTDCNRSVGNAAAMREAMEKLRQRFDNNVMAYQDRYLKFSGWHWHKKAAEAARWRDVFHELREVCDAALAEPARNCDVHTGWLTALKKFNDTDGKRKPWGDDVFDTRFLDWLFAFVTEKGANDGR